MQTPRARRSVADVRNEVKDGREVPNTGPRPLNAAYPRTIQSSAAVLRQASFLKIHQTLKNAPIEPGGEVLEGDGAEAAGGRTVGVAGAVGSDSIEFIDPAFATQPSGQEMTEWSLRCSRLRRR